jgi:hypothetical protein
MRIPNWTESMQLESTEHSKSADSQKPDHDSAWEYRPLETSAAVYALTLLSGIAVCLGLVLMSGVLLWKAFW